MTLVFNVTDGEVDGTDVSGLTVAAVAADTPKVMSDGNWRARRLHRRDASDEQAEKLGAVFGGQLGGPMEALGPLIGENLGVERAPIEVQEEGLRHSVKIGDAIDFEIEDVVPFGVESGEPARLTGIFHPAGLRAHDREGDALEHQRVRHRVRGQVRVLGLEVRLGRLTAAGSGRRGARGQGFAPAFAAARARLGIALLFALAAIAWWSTADRMQGMDDGPGHRARHARLVPRRLGRDDGGDDVPVGGADGRALRAHDQAPLAGRAARLRGRLPADLDGGRPARLRRSPTSAAALGDAAGVGPSRALGGGRHRSSPPPPTSSRRSRTCA